jgi:hypothetical protein
MSEETLDLFCAHPDCKDVDADAFAIDIEALASQYEITVDYLFEEFII